MFIKPAEKELKVPDPERKDFLPAEGREVNVSPYWTRCLSRKEIIIVVEKENNAEEEDNL